MIPGTEGYSPQRHPTIHWLPLLALALGPTLSAQGVETLPSGFASVEGPGIVDIGGSIAPARMLCIYGASQFVPRTDAAIRGVALRRNGTDLSTYPAHSATIVMRVSTRSSLFPRLAQLESFAANHGADLRTVVKMRKLVFPALKKPRTAPAPFDLRIKFDQPFVPDPRLSALVVDFEFHSTKNYQLPWYLDGINDQIHIDRGTRSSLGTGCPSDFYSYCTHVAPGMGSFVTYGYSRVKRSLPAMAWIGQSTKQLGPFKLPFPVPGTACTLYCDMLSFLFATTDPKDAGLVRFNWGPMPRALALQGIQIPFQLAVVDLARTFPLLLSRASIFKPGKGLDTAASPGLCLVARFPDPKAPWNPAQDRVHYVTGRLPILALLR